MNKRILALLFAAAMLVMCFTACTGDTEVSEPENSTASTTTTEAADPGETTLPTEGETTLPEEGETTLPGETTDPSVTPSGNGQATSTRRPTRPSATSMTIAPTTAYTTKAGATLAKDKIVDMGGHEMTYGTAWRTQHIQTISTLDDILWHERMEEVMEEYNCKITVKSVYASPETLKTYVLAGKNPGDVICMLFGDMFMPALGAGYLQNWQEIEGSPINLADARWDTNQLCVSPFDGKLYGLSFPMCPGVPQLRHVVFANKTLLKNSGVNMDELYAAVDSKQWDWDLMRQYAMLATKDTNSDGINDTWGITGAWNYMFYDFVWTNGGRLITIKDGVITATMDSDANVEAVSFINQIINTDKIVYFPESFYNEQTWGASGSYDSVQEFKKGNIAFLFHEAWNCDQQMMGKNPVKFEFALLPLPIGPKAKDYSSPHNLGSCDVMLKHIPEARKTKAAVIYNAWARPVDDNLDYSEEQQENMFQANDTKSMAIYQMLATKTFLDYGTAVSEMSAQFTHALASSVLWRVQAPVEAIQGLAGNFNDEIAAVFANATKK